MRSRVTVLIAAALMAVGGLTAPTVAQAAGQAQAVGPGVWTPERMMASTAALVALIGAVIGGLALVRSTRHIGPGNGRRGAIVALVMGVIGLLVGGFVVATAKGGLGTGHGLAGGVVAIVLGTFATGLGALAVARSSGIARPDEGELVHERDLRSSR